MEKMGGIMLPLILLPPVLVKVTFSIVCCCLFFIEFLDHPAQNMYQNSLHGKPYEITFSTSGLDPKRTPDEEVMVVLLRHYALSRDISERAALKDFTITLHTDLQNS